MSNLQGYIQADIFDPKDNAIIERLPLVKANSLVKNFLQFIFLNWSQQGLYTRDVTNTERNTTTTSSCHVIGTAGTTTIGLVVGTGDNAVAITDYQLQTQTTTNLQHLMTTISWENPSATTYRINISRGFVNNTGGNLELREVGIYGYHASGWSFLLDRSLYSLTLAHPYGTTINYKLEIVV